MWVAAYLMKHYLLDACLYEQLGTLIAGEQSDVDPLKCATAEAHDGRSTWQVLIKTPAALPDEVGKSTDLPVQV